MKTLHQMGLFIALTLSSITVAATQTDDLGQTYFNQGQFERAVQSWREVLSNPSCQNNPKCKIDTSVRLSAAYLSLGRLKEAFNLLESAQPLAENDPVRKATVLMQLSDVYLAMRDFKDKDLDSKVGICTKTQLTEKNVINEAMKCLNKAELIVLNVPLLSANILNKKGNILMAQEKYADASSKYKKSIKMAKADQVLSAKVAVNHVMAAVKEGNNSVIDIFEKAWQQVKSLPDSHDKAFALISLVKLLPHLQASSTLKTQFTQFTLPTLSSTQRLRAYNMLTKAIKVANELKDNRSIAYAKAYMAQLYAQEKRYPEAIYLTQEAVFYTQNYSIVSNSYDDKKIHVGSLGYEGFQVYLPSRQDDNSEECRKQCQNEPHKLPANCQGNCQTNLSPLFLHNYYPEMLFRLERQLGTFLKAQAQRKLASDAYKRAAKYLQQVRQEYRCGSSQLGEEGEAFFVEVANFLLESAKKAQHSDEKQELLEKAIDAIESLRETELQNYFQDVCVTQKVKKTRHDKFHEKTAIFYPILFEKKGFLLLTFPDDDSNVKQVDQIRQVEVDIPVQQLKKEADDFWQQFGDEGAIDRAIKNDKKDLLDSAKKLYKWLIEPITAELEARSIETLVIVPGGDLFHLPFAALYDVNQKKYLFEKYALAILPAWKLTDMGVMPRDNISALLMGLRKSHAKEAKKFGELTYANEELKNIIEALEASGDTISQITARLTKNYELLKNETFTIDNVEAWLTNTPYSIVHFTTHGQFNLEPNKTFLATFKNVLTLDKLETLLNSPVFREQPVELLTLSACDSARGAEMGLAGVALKTGARSALATLWKVNDQSTAYLMDKFYEHLLQSNKSKAHALQEAQRELLSSPYTDHPYYWAPFVLIGNWR